MKKEEFSEKNLSIIEKDLNEGPLRNRQADAKRTLPRLKRWRNMLTRRLEAVTQNWHPAWELWFSYPAPSREPMVWRSHGRLAASYVTIAWIGLLGEAVLAATTAQSWLSGWWWVAVLMGAALAFLLTWAIKGVWRLRFDDRHPRDSYKTREHIVWGAGIIIVGVFGTWGFIRFYGVVEVLGPWLLGALSITLPLWAAGLFVLADLLQERNKLAAEYAGILPRLDRIETAIEECESLLGGDDDPTPGPEANSGALAAPQGGGGGTELPELPKKETPPPPKAPPAPPGVMVTTLVLLLSGFLAASTRVVAQDHCAFTELNVWFDASDSPAEAPVRALGDTVAKLAATLPCLESVHLYRFASAGPILDPPWRTLPLPPPPTYTCSECKGEMCWSKPVQARYERECQHAKEVAEQARRELLQRYREKLVQLFAEVPLNMDAHQTCLKHVLSRSLMEPNALSIIITDGAHYNCQGGALPATDTRGKTDARQVEVVVILVRKVSDEDFALDKIRERRDELLRFAEGRIKVILSFEVDRLAEELASKESAHAPQVDQVAIRQR